jgi:hypothetical protein
MAVKHLPIRGYEGLYSVTDDGRIWSHKSKKYLSLSNRSGYLAATLFKDGKDKKVLVHRIVAETYIPNPQGKPQINHKDGKKRNNRVSNLEWATPRENGIHATKLGLIDPSLSNKNGLLNGEGNGRSKLTWQKVHQIRIASCLVEQGETPWKEYGISGNEYYNIIRNRTWVLEPPYWDTSIKIRKNHNYEKNPNSKLTRDQIIKMREDHKNRLRGDKTWEKYGISSSMYWKIISGENWRFKN